MSSRRAISLLVTLLLAGCTADEETRRGESGEFCNGRDLDCRAGLVCESSVCTTSGPAPIYDCDEICQRLADCDASESACASDCRLTTSEWELRARNEFGVCVVEDLSCEEARASFPPQTCYRRIPVPTQRRERCDGFVKFARDCGASIDVLERVLEGCVAVARVSPDTRWGETERCEAEQETGNCSELATCFNETLALQSPITL